MDTIFRTFHEYRELGDIAWLRNFDQAMTLANRESKPVLLLFQEIPGCSTCVNFGQDVLSNPLMVELITDSFIPLAIYNNHPGADAEILARFNEAAWNNPVVHFLASDGSAIVPKLANRYDTVGLYEKIVAVLTARGVEIPGYVRMLGRDLLIEYGLADTATYETPCFWSGETSLAQHEAVIATDAGWIGGEEVVRVYFDPRVAGRDQLDAYAREEGFTPGNRSGFRLDKEPQFYLGKTVYRFLPLSPAQRSAINCALPYKQDGEALLSPQQRQWLHEPGLEAHSTADMYRQDLRKGWAALQTALPALNNRSISAPENKEA